ncbi:3-oxoacyl-ACP reductase FabG [Micromonospora sp. NPDC007271]|uniref:3-oxoacyl-ACP reductase FabG n=1 Tax=Micromonospora sp. NPDC007271 TaxID=3154587 RepID=UPI0033C2D28F
MALLEGRSVAITGGAQGIGYQIAKVAAAHGAHVYLSDRTVDAAQAAAAELSADGAPVVGLGCDVTSPEQYRALVDRVVRERGRLDVLVNNAGITRDAMLHRMSLDDFDAVVAVHLKGCWLGTRTAAEVMREQRSGSIVNVSSLAGKVGNIGQTNYAAAKAGIVGLTKAAAKELAGRNVRVNAIQPGIIRTAMTAAIPAEVLEAKARDIPLQRMGEPVEVANVALFLASDLSSYMTGAVLEVAGGRFM